MADYAELITYMKATLHPNASNCPVFAFGGSYGGMLTTWFRRGYPNIVMGGLAASAPFAFDGTGVSPYAFSDAATQTFAQAGQNCDTIIANAFATMEKVANEGAAGLARLAEDFSLCGGASALPSLDAAWDLIYWAVGGLQGMAMLDYPYPTNYGIPLPAWPVNQTCDVLINSPISDDDSLIKAFSRALGAFYNGTGAYTCYNITTDVPDWGGCCGWDYLACTEMYLVSATGSRNMFPPSPWNLTNDILNCKESFSVDLRPEWGKIQFGGFDLKDASHIIFSNGLLDPWHTSGVLHNLSDTLIAIVIPESAHHLDLRAPNDADPQSVTEARIQEAEIINEWLSDWFLANSN